MFADQRKSGKQYATVAASQTAAALSATGATGDYLEIVWIVPATTSPGVVAIKDGGDTAITIFTGGASSVLDLRPQPVPLGINSKTGGWQITTGANVSVVATGQYS